MITVDALLEIAVNDADRRRIRRAETIYEEHRERVQRGLEPLITYTEGGATVRSASDPDRVYPIRIIDSPIGTVVDCQCPDGEGDDGPHCYPITIRNKKVLLWLCKHAGSLALDGGIIR